MARILNPNIYDVVYFEAATQHKLLRQIANYAKENAVLVEAIDMDFDWDSDEADTFKATVVVSR